MYSTIDLFILSWKKRDTSLSMYTDRPLYNISGYFWIVTNLIHGLRTVTVEKFQLDKMLRTIEKYQVCFGKLSR